jgi:hypothetical protein
MAFAHYINLSPFYKQLRTSLVFWTLRSWFTLNPPTFCQVFYFAG